MLIPFSELSIGGWFINIWLYVGDTVFFSFSHTIFRRNFEAGEWNPELKRHAGSFSIQEVLPVFSISTLRFH
jgi:hypothetical protein